ncbi:hypothetical protein E4T39_05516 [Aureobasidium subglaciale]|nr:hypothetical protein E4T39_05516 [Aureobasidium subglaciale]
MTTGRKNSWLDTVLSTEPIDPPKPKQLHEKIDSPNPQTESPPPRKHQKTTKKPTPVSLDEAFEAAIKAIVPERLEATRKAKAKETSQGITKHVGPKVTTFAQATTTNSSLASKRLPNHSDKPLLQTAIEHLTLDRLHTVLYKALNESPKARSVFEKEILVPPVVDSDKDENVVEVKSRVGIKRPRFEMCRWCKEEFDVTENTEDSCIEIGELVVDDRTRPCHDDMEHELVDTNRRDCPDGFKWTCCREGGYDDGCNTTAHEIDERHDTNSKKHKRYR